MSSKVHVLCTMSVDAITSYHNNPLNCNVTADNYKTLCTAGIFATYPKDFLSLGVGILDQVHEVDYIVLS